MQLFVEPRFGLGQENVVLGQLILYRLAMLDRGLVEDLEIVHLLVEPLDLVMGAGEFNAEHFDCFFGHGRRLFLMVMTRLAANAAWRSSRDGLDCVRTQWCIHMRP